jgi:large subunit ribosomal protein L31
MKPGIHPSYPKATINCACGSVVDTYSTRGSFSTDVCSVCHPFYTGKQKLMDTAGRIDKFRRKYASPGAAAQPGGAAPTGSVPPAK